MLETVPAGTIRDDDHALTDGHRLARGAAANALVLIAANFRGVFTFLIARLLGDAAGALFLGLYIAMWRVLGAEPADREIWRKLTNR